MMIVGRDRELVEALTQHQYAMEWSDTEMAKQLGVSRVYWNLIKNRRLGAGLKLWHGAETAFPVIVSRVAALRGEWV